MIQTAERTMLTTVPDDQVMSVFDLNQSLRQTILKHEHPLAAVPEFDELCDNQEDSKKEEEMNKTRSKDTFGVVIMETECFHLGDISEVEDYEAPKIIRTKEIYYMGDVDEVGPVNLPTKQTYVPKKSIPTRHVYRTSGMLMEYRLEDKRNNKCEENNGSPDHSSQLTVETTKEQSSSSSSLSSLSCPESPTPLSPDSISSEDSDDSMWNALPVNFFVGTPTTVQTAGQVFYDKRNQSPASFKKEQNKKPPQSTTTSSKRTAMIKGNQKSYNRVSSTNIICVILLALCMDAIMRAYFQRVPISSRTPKVNDKVSPTFQRQSDKTCPESSMGVLDVELLP